MLSIKKGIITLLVVILVVCISGCQNNEQPKEIHITRVIDMNIIDALEELENCGAKNVVSNCEEYSSYDKTKLIVVNQNLSGDHKDNEEVKLEVKPLNEVMISVFYDDESLNDYEIRAIIDGKTVATVKKGETTELNVEVLEVVYLSFVQNGNEENGCRIGTNVSGRVYWDICLVANDKIEIKREKICQYIKE